MGWKAFKEHFKIKHIVCISEDNLCIGSLCISNQGSINLSTGNIKDNECSNGFMLKNYPEVLQTPPQKLLSLIHEKDHFVASIPIFTFEDNIIIEKLCESPEQCSITHDGSIIHRNTFSTDRDEVISWMKEKAKRAIQYKLEKITATEETLNIYRQDLADHRVKLNELELKYPD